MRAQLADIALVILVICTACEAPERAQVQQDSGAPQRCQVRFRGLDRDAPCEQIASLMRSDLKIPTGVHIVVRPYRQENQEELRRLLQSLRDAGYKTEVP